MSKIPSSYDDAHNLIDSYIAQTKAVTLCLMQEDNLDSLHPHSIMEILGLICDRLQNISELHEKEWKIIKEVNRG